MIEIITRNFPGELKRVSVWELEKILPEMFPQGAKLVRKLIIFDDFTLERYSTAKPEEKECINLRLEASRRGPILTWDYISSNGERVEPSRLNLRRIVKCVTAKDIKGNNYLLVDTTNAFDVESGRTVSRRVFGLKQE